MQLRGTLFDLPRLSKVLLYTSKKSEDKRLGLDADADAG